MLFGVKANHKNHGSFNILAPIHQHRMHDRYSYLSSYRHKEGESMNVHKILID